MSWFIKKLQQNKPQLQQQIELPENFATDLMFLELELESANFGINTITKLLELYGQAVEYFSTIRDDRYLIFKNKTQSLLLRSEVQALLNNQEKPQVQQTQNTIAKKKELENQLHQQDGKEEVQRFLHNERNQFLQQQNLIGQELVVQESRIAQRMMKRVRDPQKLIQKSSSMNALQKLEIRKFMDDLPKTTQCLDDSILPDIIEEAAPVLRAESGIEPNKSCELYSKSLKTEGDEIYSKNQPQLLALKTEPDHSPYKSLYPLVTKEEQKENPIQTQNISQPDIQPVVEIKNLTKQYLIASKEKKIREMVSKNEQLQKQKNKLLQKNTILPF